MATFSVFFMKDGMTFPLQVQENDIFAEIAYNYCTANQINTEVHFFFNSVEIKPDSFRSAKELGFYNGAMIFVSNTQQMPVMPANFQNPQPIPMNPVQPSFNAMSGNAMPMQPNPNMNAGTNYINITFSYMGRMINVQGQRTMRFSELAKMLCTKADIKEDQEPEFIYNSKRYKLDEQKTLNELRLNDNARIEVILSKTIIGA